MRISFGPEPSSSIEPWLKAATAVSAIAWVFLAALLVWLLWSETRALVTALAHRLRSGGEFEFGPLKLKGLPPLKGVSITSARRAAEDLLYRRDDDPPPEETSASIQTAEERRQIYESQAYFNLVHKIRPSKLEGQRFEVSVYIRPHIAYGNDEPKWRSRLNDVDSVSYYFGEMFGEGEYGSIYTVDNSERDFAIRVDAYGPMLCIAFVRLRNGTEVQLTRYLDFECADLYDALAERDRYVGLLETRVNASGAAKA